MQDKEVQGSKSNLKRTKNRQSFSLQKWSMFVLFQKWYIPCKYFLWSFDFHTKIGDQFDCQLFRENVWFYIIWYSTEIKLNQDTSKS
jgi:hypothetical protein